MWLFGISFVWLSTSHFFLYLIAPCFFTEMADGPMWQFLKRRHVRIEGDLVLGIRTVPMTLAMKHHKLLTNFTALMEQWTQKKELSLQ